MFDIELVLLGMFLMWALMMIYKTPVRELKSENINLKREVRQLKEQVETMEYVHQGQRNYFARDKGKWDYAGSSVQIYQPVRHGGAVVDDDYLDENNLDDEEWEDGEDDE